MNILPFVCAILVIFSLLSSSLFRERLTLSNLKSACEGSMRAERASRNRIEAAAYKKYQKKSSSADETKPEAPSLKKAKTMSTTSPRDKKTFTTNTKLNLSPLFVEKNPLLYKTAAGYIRSLYANASFYKAGLETQILDQLIAKGSEKKQGASFTELFPDDPTLREIFYKMLKGTGSYDLDKGYGFPPFDNYFQLDAGTKSKPIHLHFAPTRLLRALFEDAATDAILKEEALTHTRIGKEKLEPLLMQKNLNIQTFEPLLSFSSVKASKEIVSISDDATRISVPTHVEVK